MTAVAGVETARNEPSRSGTPACAGSGLAGGRTHPKGREGPVSERGVGRSLLEGDAEAGNGGGLPCAGAGEIGRRRRLGKRRGVRAEIGGAQDR